MQALCILGNQLFYDDYLKTFSKMPIFMAEDYGLCTYYKFHKHKIILFLSAMRQFNERLTRKGFVVDYHQLKDDDKLSYTEKLMYFLKTRNIKNLHLFEVEDKFMQSRFIQLSKTLGIELTWHKSPMFTCDRQEFIKYLANKKKPFMKTFYEGQRRRLNILMEDGKPYGGKFSYDAENRLKIPKGYKFPNIYIYKPNKTDKQVMEIVEKTFPDHPGDAKDFWIPTSRKAALEQFHDFLDNRMRGYGPYQDAICSNKGFLHHSLVSPALNLGLLTPKEVISAVLNHFKKNSLPIESVEGFIRQVVGWRDFVRGIYQNFSEQMEGKNQWGHKRKFKKCWYTGTTGMPPLDDSIKRVLKKGYSHHIERLMILANLMNLCEIEPIHVYKWFMEMYVDSSDWVMFANVYGMGLMSDGGIFATKPYISGSNYILKMSDYPKGPWCDIWDGLYWRFIEKNLDFFESNPRMRMMTRTLAKMDNKRKELIFTAAEDFIKRVTIT